MQRHPGRGRLGPDLTRVTDPSEAVDLLLSYPDREARLRDVMVDQHVMQGVGNVYRCEVLWAAELSPWAHIGDLTHHDALLIVSTAAKMVRVNQGRDAAGDDPAHVGRSGRLRPMWPGLHPLPRDDRVVAGRPVAVGCSTGAPDARSGSTAGFPPRCVTSIRIPPR